LLSIAVAVATLWHRGKLRMTPPKLIGFLYDPPGRDLKVFFRAALYATGKRGHIVEALYLRVRRGESSQTFDFWMYGETKDLKIGSGLMVGDGGVVHNHHFLPPKDASTFEFLAGEYVVETHATVVNRATSVLLSTVHLFLSPELAAALKDRTRGVFFTWRPESSCYAAHLQDSPPEPISDFQKWAWHDSFRS